MRRHFVIGGNGYTGSVFRAGKALEVFSGVLGAGVVAVDGYNVITAPDPRSRAQAGFAFGKDGGLLALGLYGGPWGEGAAIFIEGYSYLAGPMTQAEAHAMEVNGGLDPDNPYGIINTETGGF